MENRFCFFKLSSYGAQVNCPCPTFQLGRLISSGEDELPGQLKDVDDAHGVRIHLGRSQEKQAHVDSLHKLALSLGVGIISSAQWPVSILEPNAFGSVCLLVFF